MFPNRINNRRFIKVRKHTKINRKNLIVDLLIILFVYSTSFSITTISSIFYELLLILHYNLTIMGNASCCADIKIEKELESEIINPHYVLPDSQEK
jgi:hypothetical protein